MAKKRKKVCAIHLSISCWITGVWNPSEGCKGIGNKVGISEIPITPEWIVEKHES